MLFALLWWVIIGLIAGWAAGRIMGAGGGYGTGMDILLGMAGAVVGGFLLRLLGLYSGGGLIPSLVTAIIGAVILIWVSRRLKKA